MSRERLVVTNAEKVLTPSKYLAQTPKGFKASAAKVTVSADTIMVTEDGTVPTTIVGSPLYAGDIYYLIGYQAIANFKAIRVTTDATIDVVYYN